MGWPQFSSLLSSHRAVYLSCLLLVVVFSSIPRFYFPAETTVRNYLSVPQIGLPLLPRPSSANLTTQGGDALSRLQCCTQTRFFSLLEKGPLVFCIHFPSFCVLIKVEAFSLSICLYQKVLRGWYPFGKFSTAANYLGTSRIPTILF